MRIERRIRPGADGGDSAVSASGSKAWPDSPASPPGRPVIWCRFRWFPLAASLHHRLISVAPPAHCPALEARGGAFQWCRAAQPRLHAEIPPGFTPTASPEAPSFGHLTRHLVGHGVEDDVDPQRICLLLGEFAEIVLIL